MNILTVIPCCKEDAPRAEALIDHIYQLASRRKAGCALIAFAPGVHQEMRDKLLLAANMTFESVDVFSPPSLPAVDNEKRSMVWSLFFHTAQYIANNYRWPWLWLEPDCTPLKGSWMEELEWQYEKQPKRYLSRWLKSGEVTFCHRVGVYPVNIMLDIEKANVSEMPFETFIVNKSTKTPLIQHLVVTSEQDVDKVREDAVILHGDKARAILEHLSSKQNEPTPPKRRGRPRKFPQPEPVTV